MSLSAANITRLRTARHTTFLYLACYHPATMWTATVNANQSRGDTAIAVTSVTQLKAPFLHALVGFGTTPGGVDLGIARFRNYASGTLTIGWNQTQVSIGHYVTIFEEIKPATILPTVTFAGAVYEDKDIPYSDGNLKYAPLARFGPPAVAFLRDGQATLSFYSDSIAVAVGASLSSAAWTFPSGNPATSSTPGSLGSPLNVTWTKAGQYYVSLQVTDSNGKTHITYRPVFIIDRNDQTQFYDAVEVSQLQGEVGAGGWACEVVVHQTADPSQFPDGGLIVLFAEDWFDGEAISIGNGYGYRDNIVFAGYIRSGSVKQDYAVGSVEFNAQGVGNLLDNMLAWPANFKRVDTPTAWHQLSDMTCDRVAYHILTEHSTIDHIADVVFSTPNYALKFLDVTESSLRDQIEQQNYSAVRSRITSSNTGILKATPNPQLLASADRPSDVVMPITLDDLIGEVDFGEESYEKQVAQVDFIGFKYLDKDPDPIYSLAPGSQWPTGRVERIDGVRANSQNEANTFAGYFEALRNAKFQRVSLPLRGNYRVFDVQYLNPISLTLLASQNRRGLSWNNLTFWVNRVSYDYKPGVLKTTLAVEMNIIGSPGITGFYPQTPTQPGPNPAPSPTPTTIPPTPSPGAIGPTTYDHSDGLRISLAVNASRNLLYVALGRAMTITGIVAYLPARGAYIDVFVRGTFHEFRFARNAAGDKWVYTQYNPSTGTTLKTLEFTSGADWYSYDFAGDEKISVATSTYVLDVRVTAGAAVALPKMAVTIRGSP